MIVLLISLSACPRSRQMSRRMFVLLYHGQHAQGHPATPGRPPRADPGRRPALLPARRLPRDVHAGSVRRGRPVVRRGVQLLRQQGRHDRGYRRGEHARGHRDDRRRCHPASGPPGRRRASRHHGHGARPGRAGRPRQAHRDRLVRSPAEPLARGAVHGHGPQDTRQPGRGHRAELAEPARRRARGHPGRDAHLPGARLPAAASHPRPRGRRRRPRRGPRAVAGLITHSEPVTERGLDQDGTIVREGALDRVPAAFVPVVDAARARITATFGGPRLHSAYLYGSIPRGTAVPGVSDLDLLIVFRDEPADADRAAANALEAALDDAYPQVIGVGIVLGSVPSTLCELERYDGGFFVACLCTPLLGEDLAAQLPRYRPTALLARETNGDLALVLPRWHARAAEAVTDTDRRTLSRAVARRLVRTGFTLIMPRWGGWTSDLDRSAELFAQYYPERDYPERAGQMRRAAAVARTPSADPAVLAMLIDDLGSWLAAEYTAVHGEKAPRR